ncbi:MAG TPA: PilN domain-containing protein, partial [bacterium]|nr:PilN domain-containing protein [bacterium]
YRENPGLKTTMEDFRKNPIETVKLTLPSAQEEKDLKRRLSALNALQAGSQSPLFHLARLEGLLPADARFLNFQDDLESNEIQLVVEAMSLEDISRFMAALEKDRTFSKVTLTKQSESQGTKGNWIQFSLEMAGAS